jgi:putative transposase
VQRTFAYKLRPTRSQADALQRQLDACRHVYNNALEHRREHYRASGRGVSRYEQEAELAACRKLPGWELLADVHTHPLQDALARLDRSFQAFFRRCKAGEKPGYPRFRAAARFDSFTFKQYGNGVELRDGRLRVSKVGAVRVRQHRPLGGVPKTATIVRKADGWYVHIVCDTGGAPALRTGPTVGIDVGLTSFATLSTGEQIANPRHANAARVKVAYAQRRVSRRKRGSSRRRKAVILLAKAKQTEARARRDFHHKTARVLVDRFAHLSIEDLRVRNMVRNHHLARSISDAGWAQFAGILEAKAEDAGSQVARVSARNTSQACSGCGQIVPKALGVRWHSCECGTSLDRDHNAALNIHRAGQALRGGDLVVA